MGRTYRIDAPTQAGELSTFWDRIQAMARGGSTLLGFDFPIGVPSAYARRAGIARFPDLLERLGRGEWTDFYLVCESPGQIGIHRPFYPYRPGGTKREHLLRGLGLSESRELLRRCETPTRTRGAASPLFWTLGGKQVGRAAIIGWRDLLVPGLRAGDVDLALWPFDGSLDELIRPGRIVVAETYPAEACVHLGIGAPGSAWSKTSREGRAAQAPALFEWAEKRRVELGAQLVGLLEDGFGARKDGEDPFDAVLGAFSMVEVASGFRPEGRLSTEEVHDVEGWILGQRAD